jgi:hypothetical protein
MLRQKTEKSLKKVLKANMLITEGMKGQISMYCHKKKTQQSTLLHLVLLPVSIPLSADLPIIVLLCL